MLFNEHDKSSPVNCTHLCHVIPTKWRSYRGGRFCDVISPYIYFRQSLSSFCRRVVSGTAVYVIGRMNTMNSPAGVVLRQQLSTTPERVKRQAQNVDLGILAS